MEILKVNSVTSGYDKESILKEVSLNIDKGKIVGLIGSNGAGKTTLIKTILGILPIMSGSIDLLGKNVLEFPENLKNEMAYIPETPLLYDEFTLFEHLQFTAMAHDIEKSVFTERMNELLEQFNMKDKLHHFPNTFSKGMKQKVMIMCAFLYNPSLLIVDEPFIGLDPTAISLLIKQIQQKREKGMGILLCTHVLDTAEKICDEFVLINDGKVIISGGLKVLQEQSGLIEQSLTDIFCNVMGAKT
ncbi:ABC transporter ATP-binding protein [Serpentinicella sp. ANB-PHB4]|uniref:ABC transporter ATP-binding protein n=1 Tax=Serpentinicella sp. ANB-PHB4 TaxID=3074076 RepID=UPI002859FE29|nr:ABC transporter ATP-binding protein [Serpentinicella sp. ANB-PHB4]MDR5659653.1 ABC transporter ATP-binding protein [Serpentinicella sp. ANB-PHB4]